MTELTKSQMAAVKHLKSFKQISILIGLSGFLGLLFGLYSVFFRPVSPDVKHLIFTLICFSFAILILGCLLKQAYNIIEKLYKK